MKLWFQRQGYQEDVMNLEMNQVIFTGNVSKSNNKNKGASFVLTYHPLLRRLIFFENTFICST